MRARWGHGVAAQAVASGAPDVGMVRPWPDGQRARTGTARAWHACLRCTGGLELGMLADQLGAHDARAGTCASLGAGGVPAGPYGCHPPVNEAVLAGLNTAATAHFGASPTPGRRTAPVVRTLPTSLIPQ
ncbi:hypothetical protein GCM10012286_35410 [Streptomyces lasiicapitis]|uniref:Uncharacterized protein n=1 Tax=Streptomyces lasiicapitis TaxID=1923961 RepID=A0ABQ2M4L4_9ACTN|nr:hypothetical protein GCM10012286_35410 [Streptomyces lasiicapitis]